MDVRLLHYWQCEAEAIMRRRTAQTAHAVRAGFSDKNGFTGFIRDLELTHSRKQLHNDAWETLKQLKKQ